MSEINILSEVVIGAADFQFDMEAAQRITDTELEAHLNNTLFPPAAAVSSDETQHLETVSLSDDDEVLVQACEEAERVINRQKMKYPRRNGRYWPIFHAKGPASTANVAPGSSTSAPTLSTSAPSPSTTAAPSPSLQSASTAAPWLNNYQSLLEKDLDKFKLLNEEMQNLTKIRECYGEFIEASEECKDLEKKLKSARERSQKCAEKLERLKRVAVVKYKRQF